MHGRRFGKSSRSVPTPVPIPMTTSAVVLTPVMLDKATVEYSGADKFFMFERIEGTNGISAIYSSMHGSYKVPFTEVAESILQRNGTPGTTAQWVSIDPRTNKIVPFGPFASVMLELSYRANHPAIFDMESNIGVDGIPSNNMASFNIKTVNGQAIRVVVDTRYNEMYQVTDTGRRQVLRRLV